MSSPAGSGQAHCGQFVLNIAEQNCGPHSMNRHMHRLNKIMLMAQSKTQQTAQLELGHYNNYNSANPSYAGGSDSLC